MDCAETPVAVAEKPTPKKCNKCAESQGQFPIRGDLLCAHCFLTATEHRFKSTLRTQIPFKRGEKLLIAVSGGANSMSLLHMIAHALDPDRNKRHMNFVAEILHIDVTSAYCSGNDATPLLTHIQNYGLPVSVVRLEDLFPEEVREVREHQDPVGADYLYFLVRRAIVAYAESHNADKVLLGESGSRVASRLLSWLCKGRGVAIYREIGYQTSLGRVMLCRPLRDVLDNEVALYTHLESLTVFPRLPLAQKFDLPGFGSVELLIQAFLQNLQEKFPATTHTVLRTAGKLTEKVELPSCPLCLCPQDAPQSVLEGVLGSDHCFACEQLLRRVRGSPSR